MGKATGRKSREKTDRGKKPVGESHISAGTVELSSQDEAGQPHAPPQQPRKPNPADEEDKLWAAEYAKMTEQVEREEAEKKRILAAKSRSPSVSPMSPPQPETEARMLDEDWEETFSAMSDPQRAIELIQRRIDNPKKLAILMERFGKNDEMKNLLMQRSDAELGRLKACDSALWGFFTEASFPDFYRSRLGGSKFTPNVMLAPPVEGEPAASSAVAAKKPYAAGKDQKRAAAARPGTVVLGHNRISADFLYSLKAGNKSLAKALEEASGNYVNYTNDVDGKELDAKTRLELFNSHLLIADQVLASRREKLQQLYSQLSQGVGTPISDAERKAEDELKSCIVNQTACGERRVGRKKYKVNMDMLRHRGKMNAVEIMDRRYQCLVGGENEDDTSQGAKS